MNSATGRAFPLESAATNGVLPDQSLDMRPTTHALEIRDARLDDAPALAALLEQLGFPSSSRVIAQRLTTMLDAGELVLVAVQAAVPLGLLTVHVTPVLHRPTPVGRLTALIVAEHARGHGVGRALVAAAERRLTGQSCQLVEVTSNRRLTDAHAFYERLGYEVTSLRFKKFLPPRD